MNQAVTVVFPLPVVLALGAVVLVLLAVTAILISLRKPARIRIPDWAHGRDAAARPHDRREQTFRLGHLHIDGLGDPADRATRSPR